MALRQRFLDSSVVQAGADTVLDGLREVMGVQDEEHDGARRTLFYVLFALTEAGSEADRAAVHAALDKLFPRGLSIVNATWRAEVGATETFAVACESAEVKAALPVLAETLKDPAALMARCITAGRALGKTLDQIDAHMADLVEQGKAKSGEGTRAVRNDCMKTWRMFLDAVDKAYPEDGPDAAAREALIGPYLREVAKAAKPSPKVETAPVAMA